MDKLYGRPCVAREIVELAERSCTSEIWSLIVDAPDHHRYQRACNPFSGHALYGALEVNRLLDSTLHFLSLGHFSCSTVPQACSAACPGRRAQRPSRTALLQRLNHEHACASAAKPRCSGPILNGGSKPWPSQRQPSRIHAQQDQGCPTRYWRPPCNGHTSCDRTFLTMRCPAVAARHGDVD